MWWNFVTMGQYMGYGISGNTGPGLKSKFSKKKFFAKIILFMVNFE